MKPLDPSFPDGYPSLPAITSNATRIQVFTHRSLHGRPSGLFEDPQEDPSPDNESLEHLGDAVLCLCVTDIIRKLYPNLRPGAATNIRSKLVCNENLAVIASKYHLGAHLRMNETQSSLRESNLILADTFEAYLGGLYANEDLEAVVRPWLNELFTPFAIAAYSVALAEHRDDTHNQPPPPPRSPPPKPPSAHPDSNRSANNSQDSTKQRTRRRRPRNHGRAQSNSSSTPAPLSDKVSTQADSNSHHRPDPNRQQQKRSNAGSSGKRTANSGGKKKNANGAARAKDPASIAAQFPIYPRQGTQQLPPRTPHSSDPASDKPHSNLPPLPAIENEVIRAQVFRDWMSLDDEADANEEDSLYEMGQSILDMCVTDIQHNVRPGMFRDQNSFHLRTLRITVLSDDNLAQIATEYDLGARNPMLPLLEGAERNRLLAITFMTYVGGLCEDKGYINVVQPWLNQLFTPYVRNPYVGNQSTRHPLPSISRPGVRSSPTTRTQPDPKTSVPPSRDRVSILNRYASNMGPDIFWASPEENESIPGVCEVHVIAHGSTIGSGRAEEEAVARDIAAGAALDNLLQRYGGGSDWS